MPPTGKLTAPGVGVTSSTAAAAANAVANTDIAAQRLTDPQALADQLNKHLNDSGLPDQFRLDPAGKLIQQVNPSTGEVIGEFAASEFPALARSVGGAGLLVDSLA